MDPIQMLRDGIREAHQVMEDTMADVTPEMLHWCPPGRAMPIAAHYAHTVVGEDAMLSFWLKQGPPLFATTWRGRVGLSEPQPGEGDWSEWARRVQVDLAALREYAAAVYQATDEYVASLTPAELAEPIVNAPPGVTWSKGHALGAILAGHFWSHCGEVSCLKGVQGARGYPF